MEQGPVKKAAPRRKGEDVGTTPNPEVTQRGGAIKKRLDEMADEVDKLLEENAEQFVENFVQRGGQ